MQEKDVGSTKLLLSGPAIHNMELNGMEKVRVALESSPC